MVNIISHWGNTNQNHNGYHFTPITMAIIKQTNKKQKKIARVGETVENRNVYSGNITWHSYCGKQFGSTQNVEHRGFPGGAVVKNPPANAGDTGSSPGPGRFHMPQSN